MEKKSENDPEMKILYLNLLYDELFKTIWYKSYGVIFQFGTLCRKNSNSKTQFILKTDFHCFANVLLL